MPLVDITNPDVIKFLVENYEKTTRLRLKWNTLHGEKMQHAATLQREEKGYHETDVIRENMAGGLAAMTRDHRTAASNRRLKGNRDAVHIPGVSDLKKGHSIPEVRLGSPKDDAKLARSNIDLTFDPLMRPIEPKQKAILYKPIPTYGREVYLKSRNRIAPEKKYYFAETSGWVYGWRLDDSYFSRNAPKCGRVWRLTRDVKSRTGPHPDPDHYTQTAPHGSSKCS